MNQKINDGGPAFPHERQIRCHGEVIDCEVESGISIRDYFAAAALQGILSSPQTAHSMIIANAAYKAADAMLRAREAK